jgi:hypothetical protein
MRYDFQKAEYDLSVSTKPFGFPEITFSKYHRNICKVYDKTGNVIKIVTAQEQERILIEWRNKYGSFFI